MAFAASRWSGAFLTLVLAACAHPGPIVSPPVSNTAGTPANTDPVGRVIAAADQHLASGMALLNEGHLEKARAEFDQAVDLYLTSPGGASANARLQERYRRTLEAIHLREIEALAAGDGYTENQAEPASIDDVGDISVAEAVPSDQTRRTAAEVVRNEVNDFPVELNDSVLACIDLYCGRLRDWFTAALARGGRYLPHIREVFAAEGIPSDLAYVALVESAFRTGALSRARAKGVWQFMPDTGRRYGLKQDWWIDERSDPFKASQAAARYLKELYGLFGDWNLALAGYNAGEGKVLRGLARYGTGSFWDLAKTRALRRETKSYVPLIHAAIVVAKAPEKYGLAVTAEAAPHVDALVVKDAIDLRVISECVGRSVDELRQLNPELRRLATPAGRSFELKVPAGTAPTTELCLANLPAEKRVHFRTHVVARGQTLATIARKYGTRTRDIAEANGLSLRRRLAIGTELIIPVEPGRAAVTENRLARAATPSSPIHYLIKPGDTLGLIAQQYGTTVQALKSWNRLKSPRIAVGEVLTIYPRHSF